MSGTQRSQEQEIQAILQPIKETPVVNITTHEQYEAAAEFLKAVKAKAKELDTKRKSLTAPLDESKRRIMDLFKGPLEFCHNTEWDVKNRISTYLRAEQKKRDDEQRRIDEQRRKEHAKLEKRADKAEEKGQTAKAEELRDQADTVAGTPVTVAAPQKVSGVSVKKVWKFRIVDEQKIPREYMIPNEKMIGEVARATKGTLAIPGVEIYSEDQIAAGTR